MKPIVFKNVTPPPKETAPVDKSVRNRTSSSERKETSREGKGNSCRSGAKGFTADSTGCLEKIRAILPAPRKLTAGDYHPSIFWMTSRKKKLGQADNTLRARKIEEALKSYGVEAKVVQINAGPTVTQFGVEPGWDIKTREIKERDKDGYCPDQNRRGFPHQSQSGKNYIAG